MFFPSTELLAAVLATSWPPVVSAAMVRGCEADHHFVPRKTRFSRRGRDVSACRLDGEIEHSVFVASVDVVREFRLHFEIFNVQVKTQVMMGPRSGKDLKVVHSKVVKVARVVMMVLTVLTVMIPVRFILRMSWPVDPVQSMREMNSTKVELRPAVRNLGLHLASDDDLPDSAVRIPPTFAVCRDPVEAVVDVLDMEWLVEP